MNIGIVTTWMQRGATFVTLAYAKALVMKHNVFIFARGGEEYDGSVAPELENSVFYSKPNILDFSGTPVNRREFLEWLNENSIDCVLFNEQQSWEPILWCKDVGVATACYVDYYTDETVHLFSIFDLVLCNTKRHYSVFKGLENSFYIPWGTNVPDNSVLDREFRRELIFSLGHNAYRKGFDFFLQALKAEKSCINNFNIKVYTQRALNLATDDIALIEGLGDQIEFNVGDFSINEILCNRGVYMYLSRLDGIGLSLPEALAYGMIPIISNHPPMNEFVDKDFAGLVGIDELVKRADNYYFPECVISIEGLIKELRRITSLSNEELEQKSIEAYDYALEHLNWEKNFSGLSNIFETHRLSSDADIRKEVLAFENQRKANLSWKQKLSYIKRNLNKRFDILFNI